MDTMIDAIDDRQVPRKSSPVVDDMQQNNTVNSDQNSGQTVDNIDEKPIDCQKSVEESADPMTTDDKENDDNNQEMTVDDGGGDSDQTDGQVVTTDSSISKGTRHQYSKEELIAISKLSAARIRPKCLDTAYMNAPELTPGANASRGNYKGDSRANNLWDPDKWMSVRSPAAPVAGPNAKHTYNKRDTNESFPKKGIDLKDRKDSDPYDPEDMPGLVLSPARLPWGSGCRVEIPKTSVLTDTKQTRSKSIDEDNDHYKPKDKYDKYGGNKGPTGRVNPKDREVYDHYERHYDNKDNRRTFGDRQEPRVIDSRDRSSSYRQNSGNNGFRRSDKDGDIRTQGSRWNDDNDNDRNGRYGSKYGGNQRNYGSQNKGYGNNRYDNRYNNSYEKEDKLPDWMDDDVDDWDMESHAKTENTADNDKTRSQNKSAPTRTDNKPKNVDPQPPPPPPTTQTKSEPMTKSSVETNSKSESSLKTSSDEKNDFDVNEMFGADSLQPMIGNLNEVSKSRFGRWKTDDTSSSQSAANVAKHVDQPYATAKGREGNGVAPPMAANQTQNSTHESPNHRNIIDMLMGSTHHSSPVHQTPAPAMHPLNHYQKLDQMARTTAPMGYDRQMAPSMPQQGVRLPTNHTQNAFTAAAAQSPADNRHRIMDLLMGQAVASAGVPHMPTHPKLDPTKMVNLDEIEGNFKHMSVQRQAPSAAVVRDEPSNDRQAFDKIIHALQKQSGRNESAFCRTTNQNLVLPKQQQQPAKTAPSIMDLLKQQELIEREVQHQMTAEDAQRIREQNALLLGQRNGANPRADVSPPVIHSMDAQLMQAMAAAGVGGAATGRVGRDNWSPPTNAIPKDRQIVEHTQWLMQESMAKRQQHLLQQQQQHQQQQQMEQNLRQQQLIHNQQQLQQQQQMDANYQQHMQNAMLRQRQQQQLEAILKAQQMNDQHNRTNTPPAGGRQTGMGSQQMTTTAGHFTPTSVMRKMHSDRGVDREVVKTSPAFAANTAVDDSADANSSHQRYEYLTKQSSIMRPIIKSNNSPTVGGHQIHNNVVNNHHNIEQQLPKLFNN